ncbi:hypothetical protein SPLC1_S032140 [Arthrospira platensis C1]|nr:hypothetical protein SPLC1_S032140 [Arthrospira platensis C1]
MVAVYTPTICYGLMASWGRQFTVKLDDLTSVNQD